ncbi:hypothetical protein ACIRRA_18865 [Nocardia sp. NPDC101769]|uniref:hypothetical protein n=1 Tax=Nocardia sp. NPDC101769 TaxID=3364333 RepID=UPI003812E7D0
MNSAGVTLEACGIAELAAVVETLSNSVLHGNLNRFSDADVVELMQRLETCKRQLSALDSRLIIEAANRLLPAPQEQRQPVGVEDRQRDSGCNRLRDRRWPSPPLAHRFSPIAVIPHAA